LIVHRFHKETVLYTQIGQVAATRYGEIKGSRDYTKKLQKEPEA